LAQRGETAKLVRDIKLERDNERSGMAIDRTSLARVQAEVSRMVSILDENRTKLN
jgi:hypothetical protein